MKEVWIGFARDCYRCAGTNKIFHATKPEKLLGLRGPIKVYFCGLYWKLSNYAKLKQALRRLETFEDLECEYRC